MRIRRFFSPPEFADRVQAERARVLAFIVWSHLLVCNAQFLVFFFLLPQNWRQMVAIIFTFNFTLPPLLYLNHRGRTQLAGALLLAVIWLTATVLSLMAGGFPAVVILLYVEFVPIAGLIFDRRGAAIAGIVFCLTGLGLVLLQRSGVLLNRVNQTMLAYWLSVSMGFEFVVIFQFLSSHWIKQAWRQTERAEAALRRSRDELETRVHERTSELRELNAKLQNTNTELQNVNQELEAFSYSVSHDLRRPLRAVTGFTDLMMAEHAVELSSDAQNLMALIRDGASQMNQLIEALLHLSRIERQPMVLRPVDIAELARQVIKELRAEEPGRNMDIRVADLPECMGDSTLLRQVLVNLLSNAMKYTRDRPVAVIGVDFKSGTDDGKSVYFVRDNGAGFDMQHADKLFGVFQRLHSAEQFKGTGIGLSIVRRIIHRHGGTIWAEAAVDRGATFYFALPTASAQ